MISYIESVICSIATGFCWIAGLFALYALVAYIRRKIVKPNYLSQTVWVTGASSGIG
jgi:NADPH:quinone reductase-like Zn-dependent oxidoreductase